MNKRPLSKRRLVLVLLAVAIPSIALIGLGVGLIVQETQLEESRRIEAFENTFQSFSVALGETAAGIRDDAAAQTISNGWSPGKVQYHESVVLVALIENGDLKLPWELSDHSKVFAGRVHSGLFGRDLQRADRLEFISGLAEQAATAYRRAALSAADSVQRAYANMSLARVLSKSGQFAEAAAVRRELLNLNVHITDDFGIPLALYAAQQLASISTYHPELIASLASYARLPLYLSPQAGFMYRAVHDTLRTLITADEDSTIELIDDFAQATLSSIRLQEDFRSILPRLVSQTGERGYTLHANDTWLLSTFVNDSVDQEILVVMDARRVVHETAERMNLADLNYDVSVLSSESSPPNEWLGPPYQGIYAQLTSLDSPGEGNERMSRISFIILAMVLIISLTSLGFYLWWRDTRREMVMAQLRSDFVSSVSHELKTPLTSIRMFAETLRYRAPPTEVRGEYLDTIISESGRLTRLLNNVLDFSKIGKGVKDYQIQPIDALTAIEAALEAMEYPLKAQKFVLKKELDGSEITINADPDALEQILLNLLTNAMKFSGESREIMIGLRRNGQNAEIWVRDWGIGIATKDLDRIFGSYYRGENAVKSNVPGTGIGLSLVHHTIEAHEGQIEVISTPGEGSTFIIKLPLL